MIHKCLTIRQPHASLIIHRGKDVENRAWRVHYRGSLLIHAGKQFDIERLPGFAGEMAAASFPPESLVLGAIIGTVDLVDCVRDSDSEWAAYGHWHWLLENPQPFEEPIPYRGQQGLWQITDAELEAAKENAR